MLALGIGACGPSENPALDEPLRAAETFRWCAQPITFQPPPADWRAQRHNQGGLRGVWYTHAGSVGERIYVSEYYKVGQRSEREGRRQRYRLADVVDETRFSTAGWPVPPDSFLVSDVVPDTVAGLPAYTLDFTLNLPERTLIGREYYLLQNNYLFEAAYLGLPENLPLFERVVATIAFPPLELE
jgi:hypothetical protein